MNHILKKLPQIYGLVLYANIRDKFTKLLEQTYEKDIFTIRPFSDPDENELNLEPHSFDFILSFEVIEHLMNPKHYLKNLHWGLAKTGTFILTTPVAYYPPKWMWYEEHFHEFDRERLCKLIKSSGFEIKRLEKFGKSFRYVDGIRPLFRKLFGWYWYVEMRK